MLTLINDSFKAVRTGQFVKANEEAGEFVLDSENCEFSVATLLEIGAANKIDLVKEKKDLVIEKLCEGIVKLGLPEMTERPLSEIVAEIVKAGVEADKSDDQMLIEIVQAGAPFKRANKEFENAMTAGGYRISKKDRVKEVRAILVEAEFAPEAYSETADMIERLVKEVADTNSSQAMSCIKAYAKEMELELPKPEKKAKGGFKVIVQNAVIANPDLSKDEFLALCDTAKKDREKMLKRVWPSVEFAQAVVKAALENAA